MAKKRYAGKIENLRVALINDVEEQLADEFISTQKGENLLNKIERATPRELVLIARGASWDLESVLMRTKMYESAELVIEYPEEPWKVSDFKGWST